MLGIYGGTFDPIHYGHLRTAVEAKEALGLGELRFLPCRVPAHRGPPGASPEQRLRMIEAALACAGTGFTVDRRELQREGPSYMVDTLASLRAEAGDRPLCLIVGQDAFAGFPGWRRWRELFDLAHVAVLRRPDIAAPQWPGELAEALDGRQVEAGELPKSSAGRVVFLEVTQLAISATGIRRLIAVGQSPCYLLPDPVLQMIRAEGLYGGASG
ncbi:MAG: nicotinate-nucleotide adenylyltransferase [Candidatus Methylumidiphilus sp.]